VKLKVHDSIFVPLAKWAMLLAGNYRCVRADNVVSIKEAVHGDLAASKAIYAWVVDLCVSLGASRDDMVPFEKYAKAAESLQSRPSAAACPAAGAPNIERVDRLVQGIAKQRWDEQSGARRDGAPRRSVAREESPQGMSS
jgi:hypothetical protein